MVKRGLLASWCTTKKYFKDRSTHLYPIESHEELTQTSLNENSDEQQNPGNIDGVSLNQKIYVDNKDDEQHV